MKKNSVRISGECFFESSSLIFWLVISRKKLIKDSHNSCSFDGDKVSNDYTTVNSEKSDGEAKGMSLLNFLKENISNDNTVDEIINVFEEMCKTPIEEDLLLTEYGVYDFTGEELFYFLFYKIHILDKLCEV